MSKLQRLIDWAEENNIDLNNCEISARFNSLRFNQSEETRRNFQAVKRAIGMFEKSGNAPYIELKQQLHIEYMVDGKPRLEDWRVKWEGAYVCKALGYDCGQADFKAPEPDPEPLDPESERRIGEMTDNAIEDSKLDAAPDPPF